MLTSFSISFSFSLSNRILVEKKSIGSQAVSHFFWLFTLFKDFIASGSTKIKSSWEEFWESNLTDLTDLADFGEDIRDLSYELSDAIDFYFLILFDLLDFLLLLNFDLLFLEFNDFFTYFVAGNLSSALGSFDLDF